MVASAIIMAASAVALIQYRSVRQVLDADVALAAVTSQMRYARQIAIDQRRNVGIEFLLPGTIEVVRWDDAVNTTSMAVTPLPGGYTFSMPMGAPDTPDGFGNDAAVDFGADDVTGGTFLADGTFVDVTNSILNGSVFTMSQTAGTARVATLSGATGRTKRYAWVDAGWEAQ
jgi:hypothetical protein